MHLNWWAIGSVLTILTVSDGLAQWEPPPPGPPPCVTFTRMMPDGRVQLCTICYDLYGRPLWERCT